MTSSAAPGTEGDEVHLTLFVGGSHPTSMRAREALEAAMQPFASLAGLLRVVDVFEDPRAALAAGVVATPSLLASDRQRRLWLIGDLDNRSELDLFLRGFSEGLARSDEGGSSSAAPVDRAP